jgi:hypothetical protein
MTSAAFTNVSGDPRLILSRQQSSARYFQRPDRGTGGSSGFLSDRLDSTATGLRGLGAYARIAKETGDWTWETSFNTRTPGYETNDYAFQRNADYIWYNANVNHFWTKKTSWYQNMFAIVGTQGQRNYEGDQTALQFHEFINLTTRQFWNISQFVMVRPSTMDDKQLRGGPVVRDPANRYSEIDITSDSRHMVSANAGLSYYSDALGGTAPGVSLGATIRPASNLTIAFTPSMSWSRNLAQYVTAVDDPTAVSFYGSRYVMSSLSQQTLGLDTRVSWTYSPTMSLELYMQPFFAAAHYFDFKEYTAPRSVTLRVYGRDQGTISEAIGFEGVPARYVIDPDGPGPAAQFTIDNPDVTEGSLRGNAVFRWEYRPGSVLYVAWTHTRAADASFGDVQFWRDSDAMFTTRPDNIFLIKASWWLPM